MQISYFIEISLQEVESLDLFEFVVERGIQLGVGVVHLIDAALQRVQIFLKSA